MRLKRGSKKISDSSMWNKVIVFLLLVGLVAPQFALADPVIGGQQLPPASYTHVEDQDLLVQLGLDGFGGAWCYDSQANAILITAPAREKAQCELSLQYELEKQKVKYEFEIDKLKIRVDTLLKQHSEINQIKDVEIERLTAAALKRPNDYSVWWASGGLVVGIVSTVLVTMAVQGSF